MRARVRGKDGYMGILPDHAPLLSAFGISTLTTPLRKALSLLRRHPRRLRRSVEQRGAHPHRHRRIRPRHRRRPRLTRPRPRPQRHGAPRHQPRRRRRPRLRPRRRHARRSPPRSRPQVQVFGLHIVHLRPCVILVSYSGAHRFGCTVMNDSSRYHYIFDIPEYLKPQDEYHADLEKAPNRQLENCLVNISARTNSMCGSS